MQHLDPMQALLLSEGELDAVAVARCRLHLDHCAACRAQVAAFERENSWLKSCLQAAPAAAPARPRYIFAVGAAAAALSFGGALTVWLTLLRPWLENSSRMGFGGQNLASTLLFSAMFWHGWSSLTRGIEILGPLTVVCCAWLLLRPRRAGGLRSALGLFLLLALAPALRLAAQRPPVAPPPASSARRSKSSASRSSSAAHRRAPARLDAAPLAPAASPTPMRVGGRFYTLPVGQAVNHDLFIKAGDVRIDGVLDGSLFAFAQTVTIDGQVSGDVVVFAGSLHLDRNSRVGGDVINFVHDSHVAGQVAGSLYGANQTMNLSGGVNGSALAWGQQINLLPGGVVHGSLISAARTLDVEGSVRQNVLAGFQNAYINGPVRGHLSLHGVTLNLGPEARVAGKAVFYGHHPASIAAGARLARGLRYLAFHPTSEWLRGKFYFFQVLLWAAALIAGTVLWLLFPGFFAAVERQRDRVGASLGAGALLLIATPVLILVVAITLIGLPLALIALFLYLLAIYLSAVFVAIWLGNLLLGPSASFWGHLLRFALGLVILRIALHVPFAGVLVLLAVLIWGLGLQALAACELLRRPRPALA